MEQINREKSCLHDGRPVTVLAVRNLTKLYKNRRGIREISLEIYRGEVYGCLGPNGAGKTTLMKTITGLCRPDSGEVSILGHDVANEFEAAMSGVGCLIETAVAYEYLSAYRNLALAARFYPGLKPARIEAVLELVGLSKYRHDRVSDYSLGMKQRLGLAAALLSEPELVILDEPANGMDIEGMVAVRQLIRQLAGDHGITFLVSSHLVHDMELMCDRVGLINDGRLIREGVVAELLKEHASLEQFFLQQAGACNGEPWKEAAKSA